MLALQVNAFKIYIKIYIDIYTYIYIYSERDIIVVKLQFKFNKFKIYFPT